MQDDIKFATRAIVLEKYYCKKDVEIDDFLQILWYNFYENIERRWLLTEIALYQTSIKYGSSNFKIFVKKVKQDFQIWMIIVYYH